MKSFYFAIGLDLISYYENETHGSQESFQSRRSRLILRSVEKHFDVLFAYSVCMKAAFEAERERERAREKNTPSQPISRSRIRTPRGRMKRKIRKIPD